MPDHHIPLLPPCEHAFKPVPQGHAHNAPPLGQDLASLGYRVRKDLLAYLKAQGFVGDQAMVERLTRVGEQKEDVGVGCLLLPAPSCHFYYNV